jgi:hypothetical protein
MRRSSWPFLSGITILMCSCVLSTEPIGQPSKEVDLSDWEGVWVHEEAFDVEAIVAVVRVSSTDDGRLDISWLETGDEVHLRKGTGVLSQLNDTMFLNVQERREEGQQPRRYFWAAIERDGDVARAWVPAYDELKKLINDGVVSGEIDESAYEITLDKLTNGEANLISSRKFPTVPVLFRRIGR